MTDVVPQAERCLGDPYARLFSSLGCKSEDNVANDDLKALFKLHYLRRDHCWNQPGQELSEIIFVVNGLLRTMSIEREADFTSGFYLEGDLLTSALLPQNDFFGSDPDELVQALEHSALLVCSLARFKAWLKPRQRLRESLLEEVLVRQRQHRELLGLPSVQLRYRQFVAANPELAERLCGYHIAVFLANKKRDLSQMCRLLAA